MDTMRKMRTLGLIGGMSWESTLIYYRLINQGVAARAGGLHSAPLLMHSLDFAAVAAAQTAGGWDVLERQLGDSAQALVGAGAGAILVATNTMHKLAPQIEARTGVPLLHIADATGSALRAAGIRRAGLLGTRYTMEDGAILRDRLAALHGVEVVVPAPAERDTVHRIVYEELCRGRIEDASRRAYREVIDGLAHAGCEAVVLGCTEIGLLIGPADSPLPVFDTAVLHAGAAVDWICAEA